MFKQRLKKVMLTKKKQLIFLWGGPMLPESNIIQHLKKWHPKRKPKGKDRLPTINFQVLLLLVSGRLRFGHPHAFQFSRVLELQLISFTLQKFPTPIFCVRARSDKRQQGISSNDAPHELSKGLVWDQRSCHEPQKMTSVESREHG